uniref:Pyrin domain-containing protein n=1 Tax=Salvator merianae TaxID=96440 RepID=A0A8D0BK15_SALMN
MSETNDEKILKILEELDKDELNAFAFHLNRGNHKIHIPKKELSDLNARKIIDKLTAYYGSDYLDVLRTILKALPREDLLKRLPEKAGK